MNSPLRCRSLTCCWIWFVFLFSFYEQAHAQTPPKQNAVIAFDIRGDVLMKTEIIQAFFERDKVVRMVLGKTELPKRVFGAASLPQDFSFLEAEEPPQVMPFDFFVQIGSKGKDVADDWAIVVARPAGGVEMKEMVGKEYQVIVPGVLLYRPDTKTFEVGTESYLTANSRRFFTPRANKAFAATPKAPIRIAVDLETQKESFAKMIDLQIKELRSLDPGMRAWVEATLNSFRNVAELRIAAGLKTENLVAIEAVAYDDASAAELKEALDSILVLAQSNIKSTLSTAREEERPLADDFQSLADNAKISVKGTLVRLTIPTPADFDKTLATTFYADPKPGKSAAAEAAKMATAVPMSSEEAALKQIKTLSNACKLYKLQIGNFPESLEDLVVQPQGMSVVTWGGPYMNGTEVPLDPWQNAYKYSAKEATNQVLISSAGRDSQHGTSDDIKQ